MKILEYTVDQEIFRSENTLVYRAHHDADRRPVILKVMRQSYPTPAKVARFRLEFELMRELHDVPGIVDAYELLSEQDRWIMVLEDFGGLSLDQCLGGKALALGPFLDVAAKIAATLSSLHTHRVMHKDIDLANIVMNQETGEVKLIDFGISTALFRETASLCSADVLEGTLAYVSPEQTGRMNRSIDYRTDLYSLGVTFYELLMGHLPFQGTDALDLVHCHIAKQPTPPCELNPTIPQVVSDIVIKLMAKNAEDRYQSASSLRADLLRCQEEWQSNRSIGAFELDQLQSSRQFQLPETLYGREEERRHLLEAFDRVGPGRVELMMVSGYSGVGKSALVQEIYRPVTSRRGYFCAGKFDQLQRDVPYGSMVQAFHSLHQQILTEGDVQLDRWRNAILAALSNNAQVLIDVIPELEVILGPQPEVPELPAVEAQNRFNMVLKQFVHVFAQEEHPLVIFLDDMQWVDAASLQLLKALLEDPSAGSLLIIGAYRDNEVNDAHPLMMTLGEIREAGIPVDNIVLSSLAREDVAQFLADTLQCEARDVSALADLTLAKTDGNPFFMREFLKALHAEGLITLGVGSQGGSGRIWRWSLDEIQARAMTDNVVELLASKLRSLDASVAQELSLAACVGNQFDLDTLVTVSQKSVQELSKALWPALNEGMLIALDDNYKLISLQVEGLASDLQVSYRFAHDRIQQAAYSLVSEAEREDLHWRIGRLLQAKAESSNDRERQVFDICNHLNQGARNADSGALRKELAEMNLLASRRAMGSAAFASSNEHANFGLALFEGEVFAQRYELKLHLHELAAESAFLVGDFDQMESVIATVKEHAKDLLDTVKVVEVEILALNARENPLGAVDAALDLTEQLGVPCLREPKTWQVLLELMRTKLVLLGKSSDTLAALPDMTDPRKLAANRILCLVYSSMYVASPLVFAASVLRQVRLVARHGNSSVSCLVYVVYGALLAGVAGDVNGAYRFGRLATRLLDRDDTRRVRAQALHTINCLATHWAEHVRVCVEQLREAYQVGLETGELEYACYAAHVAAKDTFLSGQDLGTTRQLMATYQLAMAEHKQDIPANCHASWHQTVLNLSEPCTSPTDLVGEVYDEDERLPAHEASSDHMAIANAYVNKLILAYLFEDFPKALRIAEEGESKMEAIQSQYDETVFGFYAALARLANYASGGGARKLLGKVKRGQRRLAKLAKAAPMNYEHKHLLVKAELARVHGLDLAARELYESAIGAAREQGFLNEEALGLELAGRYYLSRGHQDSARHYLRDAHYAYQRWGASTKAQALVERYPQFLTQEDAGRERVTQVRATQSLDRMATTTGTASSMSLDLATVLKASQALSSEVVLSDLLERMIKIVIENAGAERGVLLLERQGELRIEAEGTADNPKVEVLQSVPLTAEEGAPLVPASVILLSRRTRQALVVDNAIDDPRFSKDPYVIATHPKSLLCQPILHQGQLQGLIYLENNMMSGSFTSERIEVLDHLSGQIAVSFTNAALYETLEDKVRERTEQLEVRNRFIRETFGRYLSDDIVNNILETPEGLRLGGENRTVTIMLADLRGFTSMSEGLPPEKVVSIINNYLSVMTDVILSYQGTIDEFIGDAILVVFGAPLWRRDDAERAVACALAMQQAMTTVNERNREAGLPEVAMGIGINTGQVVVGNIGSAKRAKYGVVGRHINLASRIESFTVGGQILVSESTKAEVEAKVELRIDSEMVVAPKGVKESIAIFDVGGIGGRHNIYLEKEERTLVPFRRPVPIRYSVCDGHNVVSEELHGSLVRLAGDEVEMRHQEAVPALTNLRLKFVDEEGQVLVRDVYAKVLGRDSSSRECTRLRFTSIPGPARDLLQEWSGP